MTFATAAFIERRRVAPRRQDRDLGWLWLLAILGAITALRIAALVVSPSELGFDEAQYWAWSRHFQFGYFTKPPLIAWLISGETAVCGTGAACVRAASPLLHFGTALVLSGLARRLYGDAAGFWTGVFYILMPGVALSSALMTTDTALLFCWSVALTALFTYLERPAPAAAAGFALAVSLGLYAKYAMIFLPIAVALAAIAMPAVRARLRLAHALLAAAIIVVLLVPNLWWNATNGFATFEHTGQDNMAWSLSRLNAVKGFEFLGAQFGVAGPVVFGAMLNALFLGARTEKPAADRLLLWLSWPILFAITIQGFLSQAHANWGATAYPAGVVLATALVIRHRWRFFFVANLVICGLATLAVLAMIAFVQPVGASGPFKQFRQLGGWEETADNLGAVAAREGAVRLVVDGRALTAGLAWAMRDKPVELRAYLPVGSSPSDQFEIDTPWNSADGTEDTLLFGIDEAQARRLGAVKVATIDAPLYFEDDGRMPVYGFPKPGG